MDLQSKKVEVFRQVIVILAIGLSCQQVYADDLLSLWKVAVEKDAKYLAAEHKFLANKEGVIQTRAQLLPTLAYQREFKSTDQTINHSDNVVYGSGSDKYPTRSYGITLTQSVFDFARWERFYQSKASANRAEVEYNLARQDLLIRLAENYFAVLERSDQLETVQSEKTAMNKHLSVAEKKLKSGLGRTVDVEDARARYLNALSKEVELQSRLTDSRYALREVINMIPENLSGLRTDIALQMPAPDKADDWVNTSLKHNLELSAMRFSMEESQKEINALHAAHYPTVDLLYTNKNVETEGSVFGGGSDVDTADIALQINVPLYSGGLMSSRVRQAAEKKNSVFEEFNEKQRSVERVTYDAYHRISAAIIQVEALQQSVKAQERMLQTKESGYRGGQNNILEVLDVQQDLSQAQQALTKARYDYVLNTLRLRQASGDLQESDLAAVNGWLTDVPAKPAVEAVESVE